MCPLLHTAKMNLHRKARPRSAPQSAAPVAQRCLRGAETAGPGKQHFHRKSGAGEPRAALQRAVRTERVGYRGADPDRADHADQAVRLRLDHRGRRQRRTRRVRRGS